MSKHKELKGPEAKESPNASNLREFAECLFWFGVGIAVMSFLSGVDAGLDAFGGGGGR